MGNHLNHNKILFSVVDNYYNITTAVMNERDSITALSIHLSIEVELLVWLPSRQRPTSLLHGGSHRGTSSIRSQVNLNATAHNQIEVSTKESKTTMDSKPLTKLAALTSAFAAGAALTHFYHTRQKRGSDNAPPQTLEPTALLAAIELGGTSCRAAFAFSDDPTTLVDHIEVPTTDPAATLSAIVQFLQSHAPFAALGVASFGPVDLDPSSNTYGYITTTPKPGWKSCNLLSYFEHFKAPIGFDTDVNAPALAEQQYGGHKGDSCAYITVGTGIGVGLVIDGRPVHGLVHPEGGHIMTLRPEDDKYEGWSNIHKLSAESMASAAACAQRAGVNATELASLKDDNPVWDDVAYYLAQLCLTICYMVSPHVIVLSGGIMKRTILFEKIRAKFHELNEGYIAADLVLNHLDEYIVPSKYGNDIGIIGAIELARQSALKI